MKETQLWLIINLLRLLTKYRQLGGVEQQHFTVPQFWGLEVWKSGAATAEAVRELVPCLYPGFRWSVSSLWGSLTCRPLLLSSHGILPDCVCSQTVPSRSSRNKGLPHCSTNSSWLITLVKILLHKGHILWYQGLGINIGVVGGHSFQPIHNYSPLTPIFKCSWAMGPFSWACVLLINI